MQTTVQMIVSVAVLAAGPAITRFLPFVLFRNAGNAPPYIQYLGKLLPQAAISLLVVYSLRYVSFATSPHALPELIAVAVVAALHIWKKNTLLSIAAGTLVYMVLVQVVFTTG
jgi:branched-subunit amino acid transport protein AzlD